MPQVPVLAAAVAALAFPALKQDHPDKILIHHADVSLDLTPERAAALRPAWECNFNSPVSARPMVIDERVYVAEWDGRVHVYVMMPTEGNVEFLEGRASRCGAHANDAAFFV